MGIKIILVYFDARKNASGNEANRKIRREVEALIEGNEKEGLIVMGDFNGHITMIDGKEQDANGRMLLEWLTTYNLNMLNMDNRCKGKYTWSRGGNRSTLDYVLVNEKILGNFKNMEIDEEKISFDESDHCLVSAKFLFKGAENFYFNKNSWKYDEYYKKDEATLERFVQEIENEWTAGNIVNKEMEEQSIIKKADEVLKKKIRRKVGSEKKIESVWMTDEIRDGLKRRREINRKKRFTTDGVARERLWRIYLRQKMLVQRLIREARERHEVELTKEIRRKMKEGRGGKKLWECMDRILGRDKPKEEIAEVYDESGTLMGEEEAAKQIEEVFKEIYKSSEKEITPVHSGMWDRGAKERLERQYESTNPERVILEGVTVYEGIIPMRDPRMIDENTKTELKNLKEGKAAGLNKMKPELYKALGKREICRRVMTDDYNIILDGGAIPEGWKKTRTKLIKKVQKPRPKDHRPIAVANISYKILMSHLKKEIEHHILINELGKENQIGFCEGGRTEFNHFIILYLVERAKRREEELFVIALDFKKAFDSVNRIKLIETLIEYRIHPKIVDLIARLYSEDRTELTLGDIKREVCVNSGIKQGCPLSTTLFKLVTFMIIRRLEEEGAKYEVNGRNASSLFFADDSMLFSKTKQDAEKNLEIMVRVGREYGLEINKEKSKVLVYRGREDYKEVGGIEVAKNFKYLGLIINDEDDIYKKQKEEMGNKAKRHENMTYQVVENSCNRVLMGKTYWKSMVLPSVMYGVGLMNMNEGQANKMQSTENGVYRKILGARESTVVEVLRGEIGASATETRYIEARIMMAKSIYESKNEWMKEILRKVRDSAGNPWNRGLNRCLEKVGISYERLVEMGKPEIKRKLREYDTRKWKEGLGRKASVRTYKKYKTEIKEDKIYDNGRPAQILFQARANNMALNEKNRHREGGETRCEICNEGELENLGHFLLTCEALRAERDDDLIERNSGDTAEEWIGNILWKEEDMESVKRMIGKMWQKRAVIRKRRGLSDR